jgi:hypothetical protein
MIELYYCEDCEELVEVLVEDTGHLDEDNYPVLNVVDAYDHEGHDLSWPV